MLLRLPLTEFFLAPRLRAAGLHLAASVAVAAAAASLVFGIWYPYPYGVIAGGRELFLLLVAVDVVLGPMITLAVFDPRKTLRTLKRDLAVVVLLQLAALGYGLWTVAVARPVHLVFEIDRFRVVHAIDVPHELLPKAPKELQTLPWTGPTTLSMRAFRSSNEHFDATMAALEGVSLGSRPDFWQPYSSGKGDVLKAAKPVAALKQRFPAEAAAVDAVLQRAGRAEAAAVYVPLAARKAFWTVLLDASTTEVLGFVPLDSF
jgi:hypothetical protein